MTVKMRLLIQRVLEASVAINNIQKASIGRGLLVFVGFEASDTSSDLQWGAQKICKLRIFDDEEGVMNRSIMDMRGDIILVSQFTLHAQTRKGNRPSYIRAAHSDLAVPLYNEFINVIQTALGKDIQTGSFGADMKVSLLNDGPVTIWIDTQSKE